MKKIIFFSHNDNKIKEVKKLFEETEINILTLHDFPNISSQEKPALRLKKMQKLNQVMDIKRYNYLVLLMIQEFVSVL